MKLYRSLPCSGVCGRFVQVPIEYAHNYFDRNGNIKPHEIFICTKCVEWITKNIETIGGKYDA